MQYFYKIIYSSAINSILLWVNKLFLPVTKFRLPPSGLIELKINQQVHFKMATNQTSYVTKLLYWNGLNSFEYTPIFKALILDINSFIDIGSNTGYYSLLGASLNKKINIHAFEPATGPLYYLKKNVLLNNLQKQIHIHEEALSSESSEVMFFEVKNKKYSYLTYNLGGIGSLKQDGSKIAYPVKTLTLDNFVDDNQLQAVDLIKIDTEGTENIILEGAFNTIQKFSPIIICETLFDKIESKLEAIMKTHSYLFFNHVNGNLKQVNSIVRTKDDGVRDCFFIHPSKLYLVKRFILP